jgi:hypothetical protein
VYLTMVAALAACACVLAGAAAAEPPAAVISGVAQSTAAVGQSVTISGSNLQQTTAVAFGTVTAPSFTVDPAGSSVKVMVPAGVQPGQQTIVLTVGGAQFNAGPITVQAGSTTKTQTTTTGAPTKVVLAPKISIFSPASGKVGTKVTITGANFVRVSWVKLGGLTAKFSLISATRLAFTVPRNAHTGKVSVHAAGGTGVSSGRFKVVKSA